MTSSLQTWFLSKWNRDSFNHNEKWYLKIYAALIGRSIMMTSQFVTMTCVVGVGATVALAIVRGLLFAYLTIRGSTRLHDSIFAKVCNNDVIMTSSFPLLYRYRHLRKVVSLVMTSSFVMLMSSILVFSAVGFDCADVLFRCDACWSNSESV